MKKILSAILLVTAIASVPAQTINCSSFCVLSVDGLDTVANTIKVTIMNQDTNAVNYPVVVLVNALGDTVGNIGAQAYYFAQPAHDTLVHTIPSALDSLPGGFTGTVYLTDGLTNSSCSFTYPMTCTVGIPELVLNHHVSIFPNPATDHIAITTDAELAQETNVRVFDITGKVIRKLNTNENIISIERNTLPAGIYFVEVSFDGKLFTKKIIFQ